MGEDKRISELNSLPTAVGTEEIALARTGTNYKFTFTQLKDWILAFITPSFMQTARPIKTINGETLEGTGDILAGGTQTIDGGNASSIYLLSQKIDGGNA